MEFFGETPFFDIPEFSQYHPRNLLVNFGLALGTTLRKPKSTYSLLADDDQICVSVFNPLQVQR